MKSNLKGILILFGTSIIWGLAFVAQENGSESVKPFTFNSIRFLIAFVLLFIIGTILYFVKRKKEGQPFISKKTVIAGLIAGAFIFVGSSFQQRALSTTTAGKAGFITTLYILFVPIFGLMFKRKTTWNVWVSVAIALVGFYFLSLWGSFTLAIGDVYLLCCAVAFTFQILFTDKYANEVDPIFMVCIELGLAGLLSLICSFIFENGQTSWSNILDAKWAILYTGIFSCSIAYTLQTIGQKYTKPAIASLILSCESLFSIIGGAIILEERLSIHEYIGCSLIFLGVILSQIPFDLLIKKRKDKQIEVQDITTDTTNNESNETK